jgi:hypothetical protein
MRGQLGGLEVGAGRRDGRGREGGGGVGLGLGLGEWGKMGAGEGLAFAAAEGVGEVLDFMVRGEEGEGAVAGDESLGFFTEFW